MNNFRYKLDRFLTLNQHRGAQYTIKKVFKSVLTDPVRTRLSYIKYRQQYQYSLLFVAGYAKSGSTWFAKMLSDIDGFEDLTPLKWDTERQTRIFANDVMGVYPGLINEFNHKLVVVKGHTWGFNENVESLIAQGIDRVVVTVRDPRDALISEYWYVKKNAWHFEHDRANAMSLNEYIDYHMNNGSFRKSRLAWLSSWLEVENNIKILFIRYEDLLNQPLVEMRKVFDFYQIDMLDDELRLIVEKYSFNNRSGRSSGEEDTKSFMRKGVSGEWREVFSEEQKNAAVNGYEHIYMKLDYELE